MRLELLQFPYLGFTRFFMRIVLETKVEQDHAQVFAGFTEELFLKLAPPGIPIKLQRFDGCKKGDVVHLQLNFLLFKQDWISDITDAGRSESEHFFIDKGRKLPFFLKTWEHHHRIVKDGSGSRIVDDFRYTAPLGLTWLLRPVLWLQFAYRKPIYRKVFRKK